MTAPPPPQQFSPATRQLVEDLVAAGLGKTAIAVMERRLSADAAERVLARSKKSSAENSAKDRQREEPPKPKPPWKFDASALVG